MCKAIRCWVFVAIASVLLTGSLAISEDKAKGQGNEPPGWEKEEKKGGKGDIPPGIEKKGGWTPPGLSKKDGMPPGWSRGEKKGWKGAEMPPGLQEKGKKK